MTIVNAEFPLRENLDCRFVNDVLQIGKSK